MLDRAAGYLVSMVISYTDASCGAWEEDAKSLLRTESIRRGLMEIGQTESELRDLSAWSASLAKKIERRSCLENARVAMSKDALIDYNSTWEGMTTPFWMGKDNRYDANVCPAFAAILGTPELCKPLLRYPPGEAQGKATILKKDS